MKRMLNTLFITSPESSVFKDGECLVVRREKETVLRAPIHILNGLVCLGRVYVTPQAMSHCVQNDVAVSFLSENGRFWGRVQGPVSGNVLLRRRQYRAADDPTESAAMAGAILAAKMANCRTVLRRAARSAGSPPGQERLTLAAKALGQVLLRLQSATDLETMRGLEGEAAAIYFGVFDHLILQQKDGFVFQKRSRRPPLDRVNAMLSFAYTLLVHDVSAACQSIGLDPQVGYLHRDRPGRPSLALDLMEDLRAVMADRLVLSLINRQQVKAKDFVISGSGAVRMSDDCRRSLITAYQERKQEEISHPFLGDKMPLGMLPFVQALLLSRFLRGDLDAYPSYFHRT